jgi:NAD(P)-dependent dehydrogenase (short-subunit alcohol dehydrogenase family)
VNISPDALQETRSLPRGASSRAAIAIDNLPLDGRALNGTSGGTDCCRRRQTITAHPISMVNAGLEGFAAALEMPRNLRVNAVSPPWVKETMVKLGMDPTSGPASAKVAKAYVAVIEGLNQGVIPDPRQLGK